MSGCDFESSKVFGHCFLLLFPSHCVDTLVFQLFEVRIDELSFQFTIKFFVGWYSSSSGE